MSSLLGLTLSIYPKDHHPLSFTQPRIPNPPPSLPEHITHTFIYPSPSTPLELLIASPPSISTPDSPPKSSSKVLLFIHGGFGCAAVWIPLMSYLSQKIGYTCYAISLRGHGESWKPGYWEMVYRSGLKTMSSDAAFAIERVGEMERKKKEGWTEEMLVLVGHSAGGGVCQYLLGEMEKRVGGLVLMCSFPGLGGWRIYLNWALLDPLFLARFMFRDLMHSRSPLSSTSLVRQAFFSSELPVSSVDAFAKMLCVYESLVWPLGMMFRFADLGRVMRSIYGFGNENAGDRESKDGEVGGNQGILIITGEEDKLMRLPLMEKMRDQYVLTASKMSGVGSVGIGFAILKGGHHVQNDVWAEECAEKVGVFVGQL